MIFFNQRIEIYKEGMLFLVRSEVTKILKKNQIGVSQKRLDVPLRCYDFWNQRIDISRVGMFLG